MDMWVVAIFSLGGSLMERIGGFTSRIEADEYGATMFARDDVGSVHVTLDIKSGNGRYR